VGLLHSKYDGIAMMLFICVHQIIVSHHPYYRWLCHFWFHIKPFFGAFGVSSDFAIILI